MQLADFSLVCHEMAALFHTTFNNGLWLQSAIARYTIQLTQAEWYNIYNWSLDIEDMI